MATQKLYYITSVHRGRRTVWEGTIEHFVKDVFGYTLDCGYSWNHKINPKPTTLRSLISNLEKAVRETQGSCYDPDCYYASTAEEIEKAKAKKDNYSFQQMPA